MSISRRDLLKSLSLSAAAGSALRLVRLDAAEHVHRMIRAEKAASTSGGYSPKYFSSHQYQTLQALCQAIIPPDDETGGRSLAVKCRRTPGLSACQSPMAAGPRSG